MTWLEILLIILIILGVGGYIAWRVTKAVRSKRGVKKQSGCGGGCGSCSSSGSCPYANRAAAETSDDEAMPEIELRSNVACDFSDLVKDSGDRK